MSYIFRSLNIFFLLMTVACNSVMEFSSTPSKAVTIEAQNIDGHIQTSLLSSFQVSGSCKGFLSVTVTVSSQTQTILCANFRYSTTFNLTSESDGVLEFKTVGQGNGSQVGEVKLSLIKDTVAPIGAVTVNGLGTSPSSDSSARSVSFASGGDYHLLKIKLINSGTCAAADFSSSPNILIQSVQSIPVVANQTNTLCVIGADKSENWQLTASASSTLIIDTLPPTISFDVSRVDLPTSTAFQIDWKLTEKNPDSAQNMTLEYSATGSAPWTILNQQTVGPVAVTNQSYNYAWTSPGTQTGTGKLRLKIMDLMAFESIVEIPVTIDNGSPVLDTIILADGISLVAFPSVKVQTTATVSLSPVSEIRISEDPALTGAVWTSYNSGINFFDLVRTSGLKTVYAQVRSASGQTSNILSSTVTLEIGTAPTVKVTSPISSTSYAPGVTLSIDWTCSTASSAGLAAAPITFIKYSVDDGLSYHTIASNLTNNLTSTTGSHSWTVPGVSPSGQVITTSTPIRITVNCSSAGGIVASGMSELLNSEWKVLSGEPGNIYEGLHISAADITSGNGVFGDSSNALFYTKGESIMRMNPHNGLVQKWAGEIFSKGCSFASNGSGLLTSPKILDITNDKILIQSLGCSTLYLVDINTKTIQWSRPITYLYSLGIFYAKSGTLFYQDNSAFYSLDLNSLSSTPQLIVGTPGACGTPLSPGSAASSSPVLCPSSPNGWEIAVSHDLNKMWIFTLGGANTYLERADSSSPYLMGTALFSTRLSRCVQAEFDTSHVFCASAGPNDTGIQITGINTNTNLKTSGHAPAVYQGVTSNQMRVGAGKKSIFVLYTTNELFEVKYLSSSYSSLQIGGAIFHTYGNGTDAAAAAYTRISNMVYNDTTQYLYVRGVQHLRRLHINTTDPMNKHVDSVQTGFSTSAVPNSGAVFGLAVNAVGNRVATSGSSSTLGIYWRTVDLTTWNTVTSTLGSSSSYYYGGTVGGPAPAFNQAYATTLVPDLLRQGSFQHSTFLPNGNFYFAGSSDTGQLFDLWIWESTGSAIKMTAGATGAAGFESSSDNTPAVGARLSAVNGLQADANGDLLIFDGDHLRKVTVATEAVAPKIYNVTDFSALSGYPGIRAWDHAKHDNLTGWSYFAKAASLDELQPAEVWAVRPGDGWVPIPVTGILLPYYATKSLNLEITPLGLLLLDPTKARILQTDLKPL